MGLFSSFFGSVKKEEPFNVEKYNYDNSKKIESIHAQYDFDSVSGINAIPVPKVKSRETNFIVPTLMEQILMKAATAHKKSGRMDLAIACLRKANELMPMSPCSYTRKNYERLVEYLKLDGQYSAAREEHSRLDSMYGSELDELTHCMVEFCHTKKEREEYQQRVIVPFMDEQKDRYIYDWLCEFSPSIAPKSFGGFRRMKNASPDKYNALVRAVKNGVGDI